MLEHAINTDQGLVHHLKVHQPSFFFAGYYPYIFM